MSSPSKPLISIALCTYNGERFLREQLDSLLAQDYAPIEIIAVDDASTDGTMAILEEYRRRDDRLQVHRNPINVGFRRNFERVIGLCRGELIATCDQDDVWHPTKLSVLQQHLGTRSLAYCDSDLIDEGGRSLGLRASDLMNMYSGHDPVVFTLYNCVSGHAMLLRRALISEAMPFPATGYHDWWLAFAAASAGGITYVNRALVGYRQHAGTQTDLMKRRAPRERVDRSGELIAWLRCLRDHQNDELLTRICASWESRGRRYFTPDLFLLMFRNRRRLYLLRKESTWKTLTRPFRFLWGARVKALVNPARYAREGQGSLP